MPRYYVKVPETRYRVEEVEAKDPHEAVRKVKAGEGSCIPELDGYDSEDVDAPRLLVTDCETGEYGLYSGEATSP